MLRDTLFATVQYCAQRKLFEFNDRRTRGQTKDVLVPIMEDVKKKGIIDEYMVDCLPNFSDDTFLIRIIMRKDRDHYRMAMTARNEVTEFEFDHIPVPNSFFVHSAEQT